jgi:predicted dehydrogenase
VREDISVALVGLGGYGKVYLQELLRTDKSNGLRFVAAIDPAPHRCEQIDQVRSQNIPVYPSFEAFHASANAELVVLATPPQFHSEQVVSALEHGSHVLCEKPAASSPAQIRQMIEARDRAGKLVAIGYQWSFSQPIQQLKRDIASGKFGSPRQLKTCAYWPRDENYYSRNDWAGRQRDAQGRLVLDSPVNNACAHFLHNMFYVLGDRLDHSAMPLSVLAELYRAQPIENYDTAAIRCQIADEIELLFIATHVTQRSRGPILRYEFEKALISHSPEDGGQINARLADGSTISYGMPAESNSVEKLFDVCNAIRSGGAVACGLEAAAAHTACMFAAQESMPAITDFPRDLINVTGQPGMRKTSVSGLETALDQCFEQFKLPSQLGFPWSCAGKSIPVVGNFTSGPVSGAVSS